MTLTINVPEAAHISEAEARIYLAGELYERKKLSLGQAAEVAGLSKRTFIEVMGQYGFSLFGEFSEDVLGYRASA